MTTCSYQPASKEIGKLPSDIWRIGLAEQKQDPKQGRTSQDA